MFAPSARQRSLVFVLALGLLLGVEQHGPVSGWRQPLFLAHCGAVLLWQPVVAGNRRLSWREALALCAAALMATVWLNPWIELVWTALLAGMTAGRILAFGAIAERWFHRCALLFLLALLFTLILPDLLPPALRAQPADAGLRGWIEAGLALPLAIMLPLAWRVTPRPAAIATGAYDLIYTVWVVLLLLLISFFGIALMTVTGRGYLASMAITVTSVAALLIAVNHARTRADGERGGVGSLLVSRYVLSFGLPYERWLERVARLSREEADPKAFFDGAMGALGELTIVAGATWSGAAGDGHFGAMTGDHAETIVAGQGRGADRIEVVIHPREPLTPVFLWHIKLLIVLAAEFHGVKRREEGLRTQQYMRAVHETGARVTHDVKNLLQSLDGLLGAAAALPDDAQVRALVNRQLPVIARRLVGTLDKLQAPAADTQGTAAASVWWADLRGQFEQQKIEFDPPHIAPDAPIPLALFDSAAGNLLQNALHKRTGDAAITIRASLTCADGAIEFSVVDSGAPLAADLVARLFGAPVSSPHGLGIGLYQTARHARSLGFTLAISENRAGRVRFVLRNHGGDGSPTIADGPPPVPSG